MSTAPNARISPLKTLIDSIDAGAQLPEVSVTDFKTLWDYSRTSAPGRFVSVDFLRIEVSPGANIEALMLRSVMLRMLLENGDLAQWQHGDELDEDVYRVAATFALNRNVVDRNLAYSIIEELRNLK